MKSGINLDALIVLEAITRCGSFAAAAEELHRVPSSVSYAIQKLEENLDVILFDRAGHRSHLTPAGKALLREGRDLLMMADTLERNVKRIATGWEAELRIAVGDLMPYAKVLDLCDEFYRVVPDTQLRLSTEVLGGTWDALVSERADLAIGVPGDGPPRGRFSLQPLGEVEFVFVVAPKHLLADEKIPLSYDLIRSHRAVAAADSSRGMQPRTVGLLPGQRVLTVPDQQIKYEAIKRGQGVGYLPMHMIREDLAAGTLIVKETEDGARRRHTLYYAWRTRHQGKALTWFNNQLCREPGGINWFG